MKTCSTPGCKNDHHAKGLCSKCTMRQSRNEKRNVTLRNNCKPCQFLNVCPAKAEKGSLKCIETRKKGIEPPVTKPVTESVTKEKINPDERPGTAIRNKPRHYFNFYCNYNGDISKGNNLKNGWYQLNKKDFKRILVIVNQQLGLTEETRWHNTKRGPKISVRFTLKKNNLAFSIEHFTWPQYYIVKGLDEEYKVPAMENDAYIFARTLEDELGIEILPIGKGLRRATKREIESHIETESNQVEKHQDEGTENFSGPKYNSAFWTMSHPGKAQTDRQIDADRYDILKDIPTDDPLDEADKTYTTKNFLSAIHHTNQSLDILIKGGANIETITRAAALVQIRLAEAQADAHIREGKFQETLLEMILLSNSKGAGAYTRFRQRRK